MEIVLGCSGRERFVSFSSIDGFNHLEIYEGVREECWGNWDAWVKFLKRDYVVKALGHFCVIGKTGKDATHALILDKVTRKLWVCDIDPLVIQQEVLRLQIMHGIVRQNIGMFDEPLLTKTQLDNMLQSARIPIKADSNLVSSSTSASRAILKLVKKH
jgi:hypothetical protein